jgi:hypothetical protein
MKVSLVSIAFSGYGRFVGQFLAFAVSMNPKPDEVVVVLGKDHGCQDPALLKCIYPGVKIVEYDGIPTFGKLRNIAIKHTTSEWTFFVSIDDKPEQDAIKTFNSILKEQDADYICAQWYTIGLGLKQQFHRSPLPLEMARYKQIGKGAGFVIPHSPFKRWLWEKSPYKNTELPNYDFLLNCVLNGARFVKGDKPTTTYLRRPDSHARVRLKSIKKEANKQKALMERGIVRYYWNEL